MFVTKKHLHNVHHKSASGSSSTALSMAVQSSSTALLMVGVTMCVCLVTQAYGLPCDQRTRYQS
eukprot:scaffold56719_cov15-Tisochrysis_lutea.AAC.1